MDSVRKSLQELIAGTAPEIGVSFFNVFIEHFAKAYGAQYAIASELINDDPITVRTLAFWQNGQLAENPARRGVRPRQRFDRRAQTARKGIGRHAQEAGSRRWWNRSGVSRDQGYRRHHVRAAFTR